MKKNVLIYIPTGLNTPELEILISKAQDEIKKKNNVIILLCSGGKRYACSKNIFSLNSICIACKDIRKKAINKLNGKYKIIYTPNIQNITKIESKYFTFLNTFNYKFKGIDNGLASYSSYVDLTRDRDLDGYISKKIIKRLVNTSNNLSIFFDKLIKKEKIKEIYLFNGRNNNYRPLLRVANILKIKIHVLEFNGDRNQVFDFENQLPFEIKYIAKRILNFWNITKNKKTYLVDKHQKIWIKNQTLVHKSKFKVNQTPKLLPNDWDNKKRNIVFFCNSDDESITGGKDYFFKISKDQHKIIKIIYNIIKKRDNFKTLNFWVRMHPRMTGLKWPFLIKILNLTKEIKDLNLIKADSPISSYEMIKQADLIMAPVSSLTIEAVNLGKPAINFQDQPFTEINGAYVPKTKIELEKLIFNKNLKPKSHIAAKKFLLFYLDGGKKYQAIKGNFKGKGYSYQNEKILISHVGKMFYIFGKIIEKFNNVILNYQLYKLFK